MRRNWLRGVSAGAAAAGAWLAFEPVLRRVTRLPYGDVRLLGRLATPDGPWRLAGTAMHAFNGAAFGAVFASIGGHGVRQGILAAQIENAALWPGMVVVDRIHPDRRDDTWPSLVTDRRIIGHEIVAHLVFGAVLGALLRRRR